MTTLSRLVLQVRDRRVQRDLGNCYALHQRLLHAFGQAPVGAHARDYFGVLYRVEMPPDGATILVQSRVEPDWSSLPGGYLRDPPETKSVTEVYDRVATDAILRFRLHANPTKRVDLRCEEGTGKDRAGKRVDLRREEDQIAWLMRKGNQSGFELVAVGSTSVPAVQAASGPPQYGWKDGRKLTFGQVRFDGMLRVTGRQSFRQALDRGIGSGKAYGFGLLSIAPM